MAKLTAEVGENATLETVGVAALASAAVLAAEGNWIGAIGAAAVGVICFVIKYAIRE